MHQSQDQHRQQDHRSYNPGNGLQFPPPDSSLGSVCRLAGSNFVGFQQNLPAFPGNGSGGADVDAFAAADALPVTYLADIHLAHRLTPSAGGAFAFLQPDTQEGNPVKQAVQRPQGA